MKRQAKNCTMTPRSKRVAEKSNSINWEQMERWWNLISGKNLGAKKKKFKWKITEVILITLYQHQMKLRKRMLVSLWLEKGA